MGNIFTSNKISPSSSELIKINSEKFIFWLEKQFSLKFEVSLEGLRERFLDIYNSFQIIFKQVIIIDHILYKDYTLNNNNNNNINNINNNNEINNNINNNNNNNNEKYFDEQNEQIYSQEYYYPDKLLIDNIILLLNLMLKEFPECLDYEFVDNFFKSIEERLNILSYLFHQITHFKINNEKFIEQISKSKKIIEKVYKYIPNKVRELQKRFKLSFSLLKYISEKKNLFKNPLKKFKDDITLLSKDNSYEEYQKVLNDIKTKTKTNFQFELKLIEKRIELEKENSLYNNEINKILKPYISMSKILKNKMYNLLNENINNVEQTKIKKYVNIFTKSDFNNNKLLNEQVSEIVYVIRLFEQQTNLVNEYKKILTKQIETFNIINSIEFEILLDKLKNVVEEINKFNEETTKILKQSTISNESEKMVLKDINKVVENFQVFQNGINHYLNIIELFNKIRNLVTKFCYKEFGLKVELICEYNL